MEVVCGIYCIENLMNHKKYIGQSMDIYNRWQDHKRKLNNKKHRNIYLQRAWNKYKENNFKFYILEMCDVSLLDKKEIYYINKFDCLNSQWGYNIEPGGNVNKIIPMETREKMSLSKQGKYEGGENPKAHPVYCPQLDRWFSCIMDVQREGIACEASVRDCLEGKHYTAGKHPETGERLTWYDEKDMDNPIVKQKIDDEKNGINHIPLNKRIVSLYCPELDRLFVGGASQVEQEGIVKRTTIQGYLSGRRKSAGKHPITGEPLTWQRVKNNNT